MLHYSKMILERMTIDQKLFRKEFLKASQRLSEEDAEKLFEWAKDHYPEMITDISPSKIRSMAS